MDIVNFLLAIISIIIIILSYNGIKRSGIRSYSLFAFFFFFCLLINTTKLSVFQKEKNLLDLYYLVVGPLLLIIPLFIAEHLKVNKLHGIKLISVDFLFIILLTVYILTKLYISSIVGWRIDSLAASTYLINGDELSVPGFTGLAGSLQWTLLMMTPVVSKKYRLFIIIFIIALIVFAIFHVKRGDVMRMAVFFLVLFLYRSLHKRQISKSFIKKIAAIVTGIMVVFIVSGNIREEARGGGANDIVNLSGLKIDNTVIAWVYSYFAINFDVVKMYYPAKPLNKPLALGSLWGSEDTETEAKNINGFNASTYLRQFIVDYQELFIIELSVFAIIISFFLYISRALQTNSLTIFISSLLFLFPFGNYFLSRAMVVAMVFYIIVSFVSYPKNIKKKSNDFAH